MIQAITVILLLASAGCLGYIFGYRDACQDFEADAQKIDNTLAKLLRGVESVRKKGV